MAPFFIGLLFLGGIGALVALALRSNQKQNRARAGARNTFTSLSLRFGGDDTRFRGELGGRMFSCELSKPAKNAPPVLRMETSLDTQRAGAASSEAGGGYRESARRRVAGQHEILFRKETATDRLGKALRINREYEFGDEAFDALVYVETNAPDDVVRAVLAERATRESIARLVGMGLQIKLFELRIGNSVVTPLVLTATGPSTELVEAMPRAASEANALVDALPLFEGARVKASARPLAVALGVCAAVATLGAIPFIAFAGSHWKPLDSAPQTFGAGLGLAALAPALVVAAFILRGRSDSFRSFLIFFFTQVFAFPISGAALVMTLNGALDDAKPVLHHAHVNRAWATHNKNSTSYHLGVVSWRPDESEIELDVPYELSSLGGRTVDVTTQRGRFDWEWIVSIERPANEPR